MGRIAAIDYGQKRIGIAISDASKRIALPLATVEGGQNALSNIKVALEKYDVELILEAAQDAIGKVHIEGEAARAMLEHEGFRSSGLVDIFDGGPTYSAPRDAIKTIERTEAMAAITGDPGKGAERLICSASVEEFRATRARVRIDEGGAILDAVTMDALRLLPGDLVRVRI